MIRQSADKLQWLEPLGPGMRLVARVAYGVNRCAVSCLFRLRVAGLEHLPDERPLLLMPNHTSSLDPFAIAAALPYHILRDTYWAARAGAILRDPVRRWCSRIGQALPINGGLDGLTAGLAVLERGKNLIWFPEGHRSETGSLQPLKPGIGLLLRECPVPVVPVWIEGAREAVPPPRRVPRSLSQVEVRFGQPIWPEELPAMDEDVEPVVELLERRLSQLGSSRSEQAAV